MPHKSYREEEPLYRNISNWNDGVEFIPADHHGPHGHDGRAPYGSRSPERVSSRKTDDYSPKRPLQRHHTEPSRNDRDRPRHTRYRSPSPPDASRDRRRQTGYDTPPRAHRDSHYPPASRHGRAPVASQLPDDRSRQRAHHSRSYSSSPPRRRDDHHSDRRQERTTHDAKTPMRPSIQRSKSTKDNIKSVMNMGLLKNPRVKTAAAAAFAAGSQAAMTPGAWNGQKGAKIATAALGAAALGALRQGGKSDANQQEPHPKDRSRSTPKSSGSRGGIEAVGSTIGGFLLDQLANKRKPRN